MVFLAGLTVLCAAIAATMWRSGDHSAQVVSKYVALFGAIMAVVVVLGAYSDDGLMRRAGPVKVESFDGRDATIMPGSTGYFLLYQAIWVGFSVMFLAAGVETAGAAWHTHWPLAVLFLAIGLCSASGPALALAGKLRRGRVVLTAEGIVHEGWSSRTHLPWADGIRVLAVFEQHPLIVIAASDGAGWSHDVTTPQVPLGRERRPIWMLDRPARTDSMCLECPRLAIDGRRLHQFLIYYAGNPAARREFGTSLSVDRWHAL